MEIKKELIKELIADHLGLQITEVLDDSNLMCDLGADSLDVIEIVMEIEEKLAIIIPDSAMDGVETVEGVFKCLEGRGVTLI
jgi:acyl carrier protein